MCGKYWTQINDSGVHSGINGNHYPSDDQKTFADSLPSSSLALVFVFVFHSSTLVWFCVFKLIKEKFPTIWCEEFCFWNIKRNTRFTSIQLNYVFRWKKFYRFQLSFEFERSILIAISVLVNQTIFKTTQVKMVWMSPNMNKSFVWFKWDSILYIKHNLSRGIRFD